MEMSHEREGLDEVNVADMLANRYKIAFKNSTIHSPVASSRLVLFPASKLCPLLNLGRRSIPQTVLIVHRPVRELAIV